MKLDKLGIILSFGCMIHCMLMPIILPLLPALGFAFDHDSLVHFVLAIIIIVIAMWALDAGNKKHKKDLPMFLGFPGMFLLIFAGLIERKVGPDNVVTVITIFSSLLIAVAHYLNHRYLCKCKHHGNHSCH